MRIDEICGKCRHDGECNYSVVTCQRLTQEDEYDAYNDEMAGCEEVVMMEQ